MPIDSVQNRGASAAEEVNKGKSGKAKSILIFIGGFFLSFVVICSGMYYLLKTLQPPQQIIEQVAEKSEDTMTGTSTSENDAVTPVTNLNIPDVDLTEYGASTDGMIPVDSIKVIITKLVEDRDDARNALAEVQRTLTSKVQKADSLQQKLANLLENIDNLDARRISRLAKIFESMKADAAAPVIAQLSNDVTVSILMRMKERPAAKILSEMPISRAAEISRLIGQKVSEG